MHAELWCEGNRPFERRRHGWEDIKIDFKGTGLNLLSVCFSFF